MQLASDPYLLELQVFERIRQYCPKKHQAFFPGYDGTLTNAERGRPRGIVMDIIKPGLNHRYLLLAKIPCHYKDSIEEYKTYLDKFNLSNVERSWYESLLGYRLCVLTAVHSMAIIQGYKRGAL